MLFTWTLMMTTCTLWWKKIINSRKTTKKKSELPKIHIKMKNNCKGRIKSVNSMRIKRTKSQPTFRQQTTQQLMTAKIQKECQSRWCTDISVAHRHAMVQIAMPWLALLTWISQRMTRSTQLSLWLATLFSQRKSGPRIKISINEGNSILSRSSETASIPSIILYAPAKSLRSGACLLKNATIWIKINRAFQEKVQNRDKYHWFKLYWII